MPEPMVASLDFPHYQTGPLNSPYESGLLEQVEMLYHMVHLERTQVESDLFWWIKYVVDFSYFAGAEQGNGCTTMPEILSNPFSVCISYKNWKCRYGRLPQCCFQGLNVAINLYRNKAFHMFNLRYCTHSFKSWGGIEGQ